MRLLSITLLLGLAILQTACGGTGALSTPAGTSSTASNGSTGTGNGSGSGGTGGVSRTGCDGNSILWGGKGGAGTTSTSRFTYLADMLQPRVGHTATLLPSGKVLIVDGGQLDIDDLLVSFVSAEVFDPSKNSFRATGVPCIARVFHTATVLQNGTVLITGGNEFSGYPTWLPATETAEIYDPVTESFSKTGSMSTARTHHTATLLQDGRVLIVGGSPTRTPTAEVYDPATGTFHNTVNMPALRVGHTAVLLNNGDVLIAGGQDNLDGQNKDAASATAELYHPSTNSFTATGSMSSRRVGHTATLLPNGKVLVVGGAAVTAFGVGQMVIGTVGQTSTEIYDPGRGTFTPAGTMNTKRIAHSAALLGDGTVLIAGGFKDWVSGPPGGVFTGYESYDTAEIYDPATDSFTPSDPMNTGRFWHTSTLLPDGRVLITGGINADWTLGSAETFK
jgi:N-acetylneuraminic acid mutarotase